MKKIDYKKLIISVAIPLLLGGGVGFLIKNATKSYNGFIPGYIFPIVWTILYILMGIASYLIRDDKKLLKTYSLNLVINLLWPIIFFLLKLNFIALLDLTFLIIVVVYMIKKFYEKNKLSAFLLIPYLLWLFVAFILNLVELF